MTQAMGEGRESSGHGNVVGTKAHLHKLEKGIPLGGPVSDKAPPMGWPVRKRGALWVELVSNAGPHCLGSRLHRHWGPLSPVSPCSARL